ncbi:MAG: MarR family transcriptional regulator [Miniphocaeibacter sp.]|uniref:MarR family winged helix-turn-helix transcriptional regulator n=1 Tax=Miniphocaeibacter sp. TaxID=3100973 RepID=UPI001794BD76|nr:MarR family transcriptional regulator [Gallicola sp.]
MTTTDRDYIKKLEKIEQIDINRLEKINIDELEEDELKKLYEVLDKFNDYVYEFVINYYKYIYKSKDYGTNMNLSMLEAHLITDIADNPGITANVLAKKWDKTPAFISQRLTSLEKNDLIYRELNSENRKYYNLYVTKKGKDFDLRHKKYDIKSIITTNKKLMEKFSFADIVKMRMMLQEYSNIILSEKE